jgi:hypothetical protein
MQLFATTTPEQDLEPGKRAGFVEVTKEASAAASAGESERG